MQMISNISPWYFCLLPAAVLVLLVVPYFIDPYWIRRNEVRGPFLASLTSLWFGWNATRGHLSQVVHDLHKKFGTFVRLSPNHVSISDPDALQTIYGHGKGLMKSDYYDAFKGLRPSIFSTRDRAFHAWKRKAISHIFSPKSVIDFEPYIHLHLTELFEQWDKLYDGGKRGLSGVEGEGWNGRQGRVWFNIMPWFNYLTFDIIGDLAFGAPFGMIRKGKDAAPVAVDLKAAIAQYGQAGIDGQDLEKPAIQVKEVPAVQILNDRTFLASHQAAFPKPLRPLLALLPQYAEMAKHSDEFIGFAVAAVAKRLVFPTERVDILSKLQQSKDENGNPQSREDLTTDGITQLVAGSDTVANTSCGITYHIASNPCVQAKLQAELDDALGKDMEDPVVTYAQIKNLPYLEAVLNEGQRVYSTAALGLQRIVPEGGLTISGKWFPEGTIVSVPTYTIHRDPKVWGEDVDVFRPERWLEGDHSAMSKTLNTFSIGPRACVGRNLALLELHIFIASIFYRYELVLEEPDKPLETHEGFIRKPLTCRVGMKRRDV
ncbi:cytochrome P450 monooxygenase pc-bph [Fomitiporia mediterranea MF3/22]|uniref:cytochrome P450 monooxygenase pc-bph n=1 Tax=Fomitiporia mediterranea (strain MF3/22) TaxID=694068 RepID=UPI000440826B|nr:cytochrome P450 monooxygenase pc-bph [Fomitiporia mediterranea MF3/22]EJD03518.1 cytochrome P450 monooxygenase pc-bph [Fomitiporia mediterranea MF3/22]